MDIRKLSYYDKFDQELFENKKEVIGFLAFSNFMVNFPLINKSQKSFILNDIIKSEIISFIPEMNLLDTHLLFPDDFEERNLSELEEVKVDDYNLNQFFLYSDVFLKIKSLTIITESRMLSESFKFNYLKSLTVVNTMTKIINFPFDRLPLLTNLELCGFYILFCDLLPETLLLEDCVINESSNLEGCSKMSLFTCYWKNPSSPKDELYIEDMEYNSDVKTLKKFHANNSKFKIDIGKNMNLEEMRFTGNNISDIYIIFPPSLKKLITDENSLLNGKCSPLESCLSLEELFLESKTEEELKIRKFPQNMKKLLLTNAKFFPENILYELNNLNNKVSISFKYCNFIIPADRIQDYKEIKLSRKISRLEIISCKNENTNNDINISSDNQEIFIANTEKISVNENNIRAVKIFTDIINKNRDDFIRFCSEKSKETYFKNYFLYLRDIIKISKIDNKKYSEYMEIFSFFPYKLNYRYGNYFSNREDLENFIKYAHKDTKIQIHGEKYISKEEFLEHVTR